MRPAYDGVAPTILGAEYDASEQSKIRLERRADRLDSRNRGRATTAAAGVKAACWTLSAASRKQQHKGYRQVF